MKRVKKGDRVCVVWMDIVADLHSTNLIVPAEASVCGWVEEYNKEYIRIVTCGYEKDKELADRIVIPRGCIVKIEEV